MAKDPRKKNKITVHIQLNDEELASLDGFVALMSSERPGTRVTRADVLRAMLANGDW